MRNDESEDDESEDEGEAEDKDGSTPKRQLRPVAPASC